MNLLLRRNCYQNLLVVRRHRRAYRLNRRSSILPSPPPIPPIALPASFEKSPPRFICCIIFFICSYWRISPLTSEIVEPEPLAIRVLRLALIIL